MRIGMILLSVVFVILIAAFVYLRFFRPPKVELAPHMNVAASIFAAIAAVFSGLVAFQSLNASLASNFHNDFHDYLVEYASLMRNQQDTKPHFLLTLECEQVEAVAIKEDNYDPFPAYRYNCLPFAAKVHTRIVAGLFVRALDAMRQIDDPNLALMQCFLEGLEGPIKDNKFHLEAYASRQTAQLIRNLKNDKKDPRCPSILNPSQVGLGKTIMLRH